MELSPILKGAYLQIVMVTDVHLGRMDDERGRLLTDLIHWTRQRQVEFFILGGDIFDFCHGRHPFFQEKYRELGRALGELAATGCRVLFVEGNHEFDLASLPWPGIEFVDTLEHNFQTRSGTTFVLSHGDQIYSKGAYWIFRGIVKSRFTRWIARYLVPAKFLDWYTAKHSNVSRATDRYRTLDHFALLEKMNNWLSRSTAAHGLFGHFHVPYFQDRSDRQPGKIISCESWLRPNALVMMNENFYRLYWDRHTKDWIRQPAVELDHESLANGVKFN